MRHFALLLSLLFMPLTAFASEIAERLDLTGDWVGFTSVILFVVAYLVVMAEEFTHLRKSKPVMLAAGIIWGLIAWYYQSHDIPHIVEAALRHNLEEYAELMLFLLATFSVATANEKKRRAKGIRAADIYTRARKSVSCWTASARSWTSICRA